MFDHQICRGNPAYFAPPSVTTTTRLMISAPGDVHDEVLPLGRRVGALPAVVLARAVRDLSSPEVSVMRV